MNLDKIMSVALALLALGLTLGWVAFVALFALGLAPMNYEALGWCLVCGCVLVLCVAAATR